MLGKCHTQVLLSLTFTNTWQVDNVWKNQPTKLAVKKCNAKTFIYTNAVIIINIAALNLGTCLCCSAGSLKLH